MPRVCSPSRASACSARGQLLQPWEVNNSTTANEVSPAAVVTCSGEGLALAAAGSHARRAANNTAMGARVRRIKWVHR